MTSRLWAGVNELMYTSWYIILWQGERMGVKNVWRHLWTTTYFIFGMNAIMLHKICFIFYHLDSFKCWQTRFIRNFQHYVCFFVSVFVQNILIENYTYFLLWKTLIILSKKMGEKHKESFSFNCLFKSLLWCWVSENDVTHVIN